MIRTAIPAIARIAHTMRKAAPAASRWRAARVAG